MPSPVYEVPLQTQKIGETGTDGRDISNLVRTERKLRYQKRAAEPAVPSEPDAGSEAAWKIFDVATARIEHADAKAGALLAAAGVLGAVLMSIADDPRYWAFGAITASVASAIFVFGTVACCCAALWPRRGRRAGSSSLLYFDHIARGYRRDQEAYVRDLARTISDPQVLSQAISEQIWTTSMIAAKKYIWIDRALLSFFGALGTLGITMLILISNRR